MDEGVLEVAAAPYLSVIIPAYNEEQVIGSLLQALKQALDDYQPGYEVLVVDDGSTDNTGRIIATAGVRVITHPYNLGNGAAIKTGIRNAKGEVLVLMDADGQHDPRDIPRLVEYIPQYDMVIGSRLGEGCQGALHRRLANKVYNLLATYITQHQIVDLTSGFRVIKRDIARKFVYLLPNTFSYPTTITLAMIKAGYSLKFVPIAVNKRIGKSKIRLWRDGMRFFLIMLKVATLFSPFRVFLPISLVSFVTGIVYGSYMIIQHQHFSNMILLLLITAVLVFLLGLIAEEINMLRFERTEE
jgi:glycosyltransferase involved in cell wall biosynthesis